MNTFQPGWLTIYPDGLPFTYPSSNWAQHSTNSADSDQCINPYS